MPSTSCSDCMLTTLHAPSSPSNVHSHGVGPRPRSAPSCIGVQRTLPALYCRVFDLPFPVFLTKMAVAEAPCSIARMTVGGDPFVPSPLPILLVPSRSSFSPFPSIVFTSNASLMSSIQLSSVSAIVLNPFGWFLSERRLVTHHPTLRSFPFSSSPLPCKRKRTSTIVGACIDSISLSPDTLRSAASISFSSSGTSGGFKKATSQIALLSAPSKNHNLYSPLFCPAVI
mmetsp:Transcript_34463/g.89265  ORF Transcript_34463/g.89265 Transcript_34463/m.89265 type:complete len:228 (+) Transcript_34463:2727-3410(+)